MQIRGGKPAGSGRLS